MAEILSLPRPPHARPAIFEEFFGSREEKASPFLTLKSRNWAVNLTLKSSLLAAALLLVAFVLSFFPLFLSVSHLLLLSVYFFAGIPALIESIEDLAIFDVNIDVLMTLAAFSSVLIGSHFEGALLLVLFALSGSIEDAVTSKAKSSLNQLHRLSPSKATVLTEQGHLLERSVKDITIGTLILVRPGEIVPLDGKILEGISSVNLVHLTGESLPLIKKAGDEVPAGARTVDGTLTITVSHTNADSTMTRIIQLVTQAHEARPQLQRWFDRLSRTYAITIISLFVFFACTMPFILSIPFLGVEGSLYRALAFLIAASPCALILALPIAYLSAVSACARKGILLKGGLVLDALAQCSTIAFDKTGTLTTGLLSYKGMKNVGKPHDWSEKDILSVAYALEKNAVHPIAKAISTYATEQNIPSATITNVKSIPGYGVEAEWMEKGQLLRTFIGLPSYIKERLSLAQQRQLEEESALLEAQGRLIAALMIGEHLFLLSFQDTLRPQMKQTIQQLKKGKWALLMLTGDHENSARPIAHELGLDEFHASLRPENKLDFVTRLAKETGLAMVGDGINDAPALARATVGICMGKIGSGMAVDAADAVLLQDNLERLEWLMQKAKQTQAIVRQNLLIASCAIVLASLPALAGFVPLWLAVVLHEGGTVLVGLNALRLLK